MLQLLEKEEESSCEIASTFSSLQQEVEAKTRKLKKLFAKLQSVKQEMGDLHEEFCRDRVDLQHTQDVLTRSEWTQLVLADIAVTFPFQMLHFLNVLFMNLTMLSSYKIMCVVFISTSFYLFPVFSPPLQRTETQSPYN